MRVSKSAVRQDCECRHCAIVSEMSESDAKVGGYVTGDLRAVSFPDGRTLYVKDSELAGL